MGLQSEMSRLKNEKTEEFDQIEQERNDLKKENKVLEKRLKRATEVRS